MKILVINSGSSSLKYQIFEMPEAKVLVRGGVERIGDAASFLEQKIEGCESTVIREFISTHEAAIQLVMKIITDAQKGIIKDLSEIFAVGHRVVHGGEHYADSCLINDEVVAVIEECAELGPLHNPPNLMGIRAVQKIMPKVPNVACFDTAFHQTMPDYVYLYPLPYAYYEQYHIRRYGFHGTSHRYLNSKTAEILGKNPQELNLITCHLGNGASVAAIKGGKVFDTSMGFTPLEGLMMGTRCGDIDPAIVTYLMNKNGMTTKEIEGIMNKKSGILGVFEKSNDMREIYQASNQGDKRAELTIDMFCYRVKKYVGSYMAALGRVDAIVFAGGMGERAPYIRAGILADMENLGVVMDASKNENDALKNTFINADKSTVKIMVVPTNEELMIAKDTYELVK
jgi:acetate kinase